MCLFHTLETFIDNESFKKCQNIKKEKSFFIVIRGYPTKDEDFKDDCTESTEY